MYSLGYFQTWVFRSWCFFYMNGVWMSKASEEEKTKKSCRDHNIMGGKRRRKKEFEDLYWVLLWLIFPGGQKKRSGYISTVMLQGKKGSLPNFTYWTLSLFTWQHCLWWSSLINQSRNPINNVRKNDRVQMKKQETHKTFAAACQSKEISSIAATICHTCSWYRTIYPSSHGWVDDGRDMWRLMSICLKRRQLVNTASTVTKRFGHWGFFFVFGVCKTEDFFGWEKEVDFSWKPNDKLQYISIMQHTKFATLKYQGAEASRLAQKHFVLFKRASVVSLLGSDLPWSPSLKKRQRRSKMTTSIPRTITCNTQMGLVRIWLWLH